MATKALINRIIGLMVSFLRNPDRPETLSLPVTDLATFSRSKTSVSYTRSHVRAFVKAVLTERQTPRTGVSKTTRETYTTQGLAALEGVNIKSLKDLRLGELFSLRTSKPNGSTPSKFYTTIRRMVKLGIMAAAIEQQEESKTPTSKPKANRRKSKNTRKSKPKAEPTGDKTVTFGGLTVTIPASEYSEPKKNWTARAEAAGVEVSSKASKTELVVRTVTYELLSC